ncbi:hypothetical protein [Pontibacillus sp. HMF3514]|uniref:hypothetical protein n=1 Tax=Pontibacillus sp. HMF3514 TaxID=2692425 RepID=UPI00131F5E8D|nr:hypothetical protein [Pontibacillus sp. HMF3514]QHE52825.1 hypothetical protein GS400_12690 [Pontibacillus sp. HMF3514]
MIINDFSKINISQYLDIEDHTIEVELKNISNNPEIPLELQNMAQLYCSNNESLPYSQIEGPEPAGQDKNARTSLVCEKKNYSSYIGGVYVSKGNELIDIRHLSRTIEESYKSDLKSYFFIDNFTSEDILIN